MTLKYIITEDDRLVGPAVDIKIPKEWVPLFKDFTMLLNRVYEAGMKDQQSIQERQK